MDEYGAAFGFFPQLKPRRNINTDTSSLPLDVFRGRLAGLLGAPSDILNLLSSPKPMEVFGDVDYSPNPQLPYGSEQWLKELPLPPTSQAGNVLGKAASFVPLNPAPVIRGVQKAGQIAGEELAATMLGQRPNSLLDKVVPKPMFAVPPEQGLLTQDQTTILNKENIRSLSEDFANKLNNLGFNATVEHSGSKAGLSSYVKVYDPETGRFFKKNIRFSDHSKGPKNLDENINITDYNVDTKKLIEDALDMRALGKSSFFVQQEKLEQMAKKFIDDGMKPRSAYNKAKSLLNEELLTIQNRNNEIIAPTSLLDKVVSKPMFTVPPEQGLLSSTFRKSFVPGVQAGKEMIVHHNISPEKLAKVEKVGGMPVPSLAISNVENPMMAFGDISLIGSKEMAVPFSKNPVYGFDAYTARTPSIEYTFDSKSSKNLENLFSDVKDSLNSGTIYNLKDNWKDRQFNDAMKAKFLKEKNMLSDPNDFKDKWDYSRDIGKKVDENWKEYSEWVNDFDKRLPDAGVNIQERIFKGYTDAGNRRYAPATLENLVKEMKGGAGAEGFFYGVGNIRAVATPKFKNLNQVKAARENIITSEQFEPVKKQVEDAFDDITSRLRKLEGTGGYGYEPQNALYEIGQTRNVNLLDKLYKDVPESLKADVQIFMNKVREMPTEYFEIKPQRAVKVGEFKGAIVPENAPKGSVEYLRNQGIQDIYFYSTPEERKELFKKFGPEMFGTLPLPLLADEEKRKELKSLLEY